MPNHWQLTTLGEATEVEMGQSPPGETYNSDGDGLPFLQGSAEFGERVPSPNRWCSAPTRVAEPGDLLVSVRAPVGDTNFADARLAIGRGLARMRSTSVASSDFLRLMIQAEVGRLNQNAGGGMFASITAKNLRGFRVAIPPVTEQRRIVDLIESVDSYIDSLQTQVESTRTARSALLAELLTNPGDDWFSVSVEESCEILDRLRRPISVNERAKRLGDVPYYGATGQAGWIDEAIFDEPLVLLGEDAVDFASRSAKKAYRIDGPSWVNNHAHVLRPGRAFVSTLMLELLLNEVDYSAYAVFGTRSKLTQASMRTIRLSVPPIAEQRRVVELISSIDKQVESLLSQVSIARSFRDAALSELLSGERLLDESYDVAVSL